MNSLPSKTKKTAFQILDRTTWTNNKAQNLEQETTLIATIVVKLKPLST
jgi:hypothetical protein